MIRKPLHLSNNQQEFFPTIFIEWKENHSFKLLKSNVFHADLPLDKV